jgi:hypothetical protein
MSNRLVCESWNWQGSNLLLPWSLDKGPVATRIGTSSYSPKWCLPEQPKLCPLHLLSLAGTGLAYSVPPTEVDTRMSGMTPSGLKTTL